MKAHFSNSSPATTKGKNSGNPAPLQVPTKKLGYFVKETAEDLDRDRIKAYPILVP